jgi:hypothetical protein
MFTRSMILAAAAAFTMSMTALPMRADEDNDNAVRFKMVVSAGAKTCLPNASGSVRITAEGPNQAMNVSVQGMPANTTFTLFVLQLPKAPFGAAWYQGDVETDKYGRGSARLTGIFSDETFVYAPGSGPAPVVHTQDGSLNPSFSPVHMFHLGMWFDSAEDAAKAGCPATVTPFNGDHTAGIQVLNTSNFPDDRGPLRFDAAVLSKKD